MKRAFTLIELLIVIAVLGVLATTAIIVLNPTEIMKQSRDSRRFEDLNHINIAITEAQSLSPNINLGIASSVYVSIPDSSPTCANLGLSTSSLPAGWSYRCSSSVNFRKTNGAGWIPVDFSSVSGGSVFSALPVDPINATSSGLYYTYTPGSGFQLSALFESSKYADKAVKDGGVDPAQYEVGDNLSLAPFSHGLVGYWNFDETGTTSLDSSGFGNTGTMYSSTTPTNLHTSTGCKNNLSTCINLDGVDDYTDIPGFNWSPVGQNPVSVVLWTKLTNTATMSLFEINIESTDSFHLHIHWPNLEWHYGSTALYTDYSSFVNNWTHIAVISEGSGGDKRVYFNGSLANSLSNSNAPVSGISGLYIGRGAADPFYQGQVDALFIYRRVLSSSQIKAIYDATK